MSFVPKSCASRCPIIAVLEFNGDSRGVVFELFNHVTKAYGHYRYVDGRYCEETYERPYWLKRTPVMHKGVNFWVNIESAGRTFKVHIDGGKWTAYYVNPENNYNIEDRLHTPLSIMSGEKTPDKPYYQLRLENLGAAELPVLNYRFWENDMKDLKNVMPRLDQKNVLVCGDLKPFAYTFSDKYEYIVLRAFNYRTQDESHYLIYPDRIIEIDAGVCCNDKFLRSDETFAVYFDGYHDAEGKPSNDRASFFRLHENRLQWVDRDMKPIEDTLPVYMLIKRPEVVVQPIERVLVKNLEEFELTDDLEDAPPVRRKLDNHVDEDWLIVHGERVFES